MLELEADHRRHAEIEKAIRDLKYGVGLNHLPSGRFPANAAWLAVQAIAHNLAPVVPGAPVWVSRWRPPKPCSEAPLPGRTHHPQGTPPHFASPTGLALGKSARLGPGPIARPAALFLITFFDTVLAQLAQQ